MNIEEEIFKKSNINFEKLENFGFILKDETYHFEENIMEDSFKVSVWISKNGEIKTNIFDIENNEEYYQIRSTNSPSSYVREVQEEYRKVLIKIRENCFFENYFIFPQSNRITKLILETFGDKPEFPFEDYDGCGIFRNPESRKWYGLITNLDYSKIDKNKKGEIEIINLKLDKEEINELVKKDGYFRAWHMNKKNWITIILDETLSDDEIMERIRKSYSYTVKKRK